MPAGLLFDTPLLAPPRPLTLPAPAPGLPLLEPDPPVPVTEPPARESTLPEPPFPVSAPGPTPADGASAGRIPVGSAHRLGSGRRRVVLALLAVTVVGGATLAISSSSAVRRQLLLSFTRQPDNFAELYFPSPSSVPTSFVPGRPLPVVFGLTNSGGAARTYAYAVTAGAGGGMSTVEGSGTLHVGAGHAVIVPLRLALPAGTTSLSITLVGEPVVIRLLLHQGVAHAR